MPEDASVSVVIFGVGGRAGIEGRGLPLLDRLLQHDLDGLLDLRQLAVAEAGELHALLKEGELAVEPRVFAFELGHDRVQARQRDLEPAFLLDLARHDSFSSGSAKSGPGSSQRPPSRTITPSSPLW